MRKVFLIVILFFRLFTNDGWFCENRNSKVKTQPPEIFRFIRRPSKRGKKKTKLQNNIYYNTDVCQEFHYNHHSLF